MKRVDEGINDLVPPIISAWIRNKKTSSWAIPHRSDMLGQDGWIPDSLISIARDYKSNSCLLGSCREHRSQEELHVSLGLFLLGFFWATLITALGNTQKSAACFALGSWLAGIKRRREGEALKMSGAIIDNTTSQHEDLVWCQEEYRWKTIPGEMQTSTGVHT